MFLAENIQLRKGEVTNTTEFLGKQLEEAKAKLDEQDAKLAAFQRRISDRFRTRIKRI